MPRPRRKNVVLLNIDMQKDFCCDPNKPGYKGTLFVPGAEEDVERVSKFIEDHCDDLSDIINTLDEHHLFHVGNPSYWINSNGDHPAPFTRISGSDVVNGVWFASIPHLRARAKKYVLDLEAAGMVHTIWPPHCLIAMEGSDLHPTLAKAILKWEESGPCVANMISKGSNMHVEHFGALHAEVEDPNDLTTKVNFDGGLLQPMSDPDVDKILVTGEALNFCLKRTGEQLIANFQDPNIFKKFVFFDNCTSPVPVPGYQQVVSDFWAMVKAKGAEVMHIEDYRF